MNYENVVVRFRFDRELSSDFIQQLLDYCFDIGCTTHEGENRNQCWYVGAATDYDYTEVDTSVAIDAIVEHRAGAITLWYGEWGFLFGIYSSDDTDEWRPDEFSISVDPVYFNPDCDSASRTDVGSHVEELVELTTLLSEFANPKVVVGSESSTGETISDFTIAESKSCGVPGYIEWLTVFSPEAVRSIGKQRLLSVPAWMVESFTDGSVLLVLTDNPLRRAEIETANETVRDHLRQ